jgi:hypothetical protein
MPIGTIESIKHKLKPHVIQSGQDARFFGVYVRDITLMFRCNY